MSQASCPVCSSKKIKTSHQGTRLQCQECCKFFNLRNAPVKARALKGKRFVVTCAVSGSPVHGPFMRSLLNYCALNGAQLLVIPVRYSNTALEKPWDPTLEPYLCTDRFELCKGLILMGDIKVSPTSEFPLSGFKHISGKDSAIFGHPKVALESVATYASEHAKLILTTGAVTRPRYSDTKAGKKGEFHHVFGAVVVEISNKTFHLRHISGQADGGFQDLAKTYRADVVETNSIEVLTVGDLHAKRSNKTVLDATFFNKDSIVKTLKPSVVALHDILDFVSASHHNNFFDTFKLYAKGDTNVEREVHYTIDLVDRLVEASGDADFYIIDSNHDRHLMRWLASDDNAHDLENSIFYHKSKVAVLEALRDGTDPNPLTYWSRQWSRFSDRIKYLGPNDKLIINKIGYDQHGDRGPNGARGSIKAFTQVGSKRVIGHSHTPGILHGVFQVGTTSEMNMGYNVGDSSWMHTHCISYDNGKRTLVNVIDGKWKA